MESLIKLGGRDFYIPVTSLQRNAAVLDGKNAGRMIDGGMKRDIIGTFYNYDLSFNMSHLSAAEYDEFYEIVTAPVDYQTVVLPYGQGNIRFDAYIANAKDELIKASGGHREWSNLSLTFTAMKPQRI